MRGDLRRMGSEDRNRLARQPRNRSAPAPRVRARGHAQSSEKAGPWPLACAPSHALDPLPVEAIRPGYRPNYDILVCKIRTRGRDDPHTLFTEPRPGGAFSVRLPLSAGTERGTTQKVSPDLGTVGAPD